MESLDLKKAVKEASINAKVQLSKATPFDGPHFKVLEGSWKDLLGQLKENLEGRKLSLDFISSFQNKSDLVLTAILLFEAKPFSIELQLRLKREYYEVDSLSTVFPTAEFYEKEIADLFGVRFNKVNYKVHDRFILPSGFSGFPLRKEYLFKKGRV